MNEDRAGGWTSRLLDPALRLLRRRWLVAAAIGLYALGLNSYWRPSPDSALYLGLGRSLADGAGYAFNGQPHTYVLPGFPVLLARAMSVFGAARVPRAMLPLNALMAMSGLGCLAATWLVLKELKFRPRAAAATLALLILCREMYFYSFMVLTDMPFAFVAALTLYAALRALRAEGREFWAWLAGAGLLAACAILIRPFGLALPVAVPAALFLERKGWRRWRRHLPAAALFVALAVAPLGMWVHSQRGVSSRGPSYARPLARANPLRHIMLLPDLFDEIGRAVVGVRVSAVGGALLAALMALGLARLPSRGRWLVAVFLAVYIAGMLLNVPGGRYLLPVLPLLFATLVLGAVSFTGLLVRWNRVSLAGRRRLLVGGLALLLVVNGVRVGKVVAQNRSPDFYAAIDDGRWADFFQAAEWIAGNVEHREKILAYHYRTVHLLTRRVSVGLPRYAEDMSKARMVRLIQETEARYAIIDPERPGSTAALEELLAESPEAGRTVFSAGDVEVVRLNPEAFPPVGEAP